MDNDERNRRGKGTEPADRRHRLEARRALAGLPLSFPSITETGFPINGGRFEKSYG